MVTDKFGNVIEITGDSVIRSMGYHPNNQFENQKVHLVGDCNQVGNLRTVIWRSWDIAMKL